MGACHSGPLDFTTVPQPKFSAPTRKHRHGKGVRGSVERVSDAHGSQQPPVESMHRDAIQMLDSEDENPGSPSSSSSNDEDTAPEPPESAPTRTRRRGVATVPIASDVTKPNSSVLAKRSMRLGLCGIRNYGNFCFVNAALQCLSHSVPLTEYFLAPGWQAHVNPHNKLGHGGKLAKGFADFMNKLWVGDTSVLRPRKLLNQINASDAGSAFLDGDQHDVHEFLSFLLDGLHEDLNRVKHSDAEAGKEAALKSLRKGEGDVEQAFFETVRAAVAWNAHLQRNKSVVVDLFQGQLRSEVKCVECGKTSVSYDPFMNMTLPVEVRMLDKTMKPLDSLYDCLRAFTSEEVLSARNLWKCPRCDRHVRAIKKLSIWRLPPLLIIHLKRFSFNRYGVKRKVNGFVDFPMEGLDMTDFVSPHSGEASPKYNLYAVANHIGTKTGEGHYTASCFHSVSSRWYEFNDSEVNKMPRSSVVSNNAYVLFYCRAAGSEAPPSIPLHTLLQQETLEGLPLSSRYCEPVAVVSPQRSTKTPSRTSQRSSVKLSSAVRSHTSQQLSTQTVDSNPALVMRQHGVVKAASPQRFSYIDSYKENAVSMATRSPSKHVVKDVSAILKSPPRSPGKLRTPSNPFAVPSPVKPDRSPAVHPPQPNHRRKSTTKPT